MDHLLARVYSNPTRPSPPIFSLAGTEIPGHGSDSRPIGGDVLQAMDSSANDLGRVV